MAEAGDIAARELSKEGGGDAGAVARARVRGRAIVHGIILVIAVLFIGSSALQLVWAVFRLGPPDREGTSAGRQAATRGCIEGVRVLARALDRASAGVLSPRPDAEGGEALASDFRRSLAPEWDGAQQVQGACEATSGGLETWAALTRLRAAEDQLTRRGREDLAPLRDEVAAHLPPELR